MHNGVMEVTHTQHDDDLVTVSQAARIAQLSTDTIRRYSDKGILATQRTPANHRRFRRRDVEALNTVQAEAATSGDAA
jgi:predicted site-specific integrase-resolvase